MHCSLLQRFQAGPTPGLGTRSGTDCVFRARMGIVFEAGTGLSGACLRLPGFVKSAKGDGCLRHAVAVTATDGSPAPPSDDPAATGRTRAEPAPVRGPGWTPRDTVKLGVGVGLLLGAIGTLVGIALIAARVPATCSATVSDYGNFDGRCFAHPQALEGTAVVAISLMLAILIGLTGAVALAAVRVRAAR